MTKLRNMLAATVLATGVAIAGLASPAVADGNAFYTVYGQSYIDINLQLCSADVRVEAQGNGRTDLDFEIWYQGTRIFSDDDASDFMSTVVHQAQGCRGYTLRVLNQG